MILTLKNIGKIKDARVELNGITVIAGENNTGKSTVGKILFSIFNSFYKVDEQIYREKRNIIGKTLINMTEIPRHRLRSSSSLNELIDNILESIDEHNSEMNSLSDLLKETLMDDIDIDNDIEESIFEDIARRILQIISIPEQEIFKELLSENLNEEFNNQINNIFFDDEDGVVELDIKGTIIKILVQDNRIIDIRQNISLNTEAIYIDDPFVLDDVRPVRIIPPFFRMENYTNHRLHLQSKLRNIREDFGIEDAINKIIATKKIEDIISKMNTVFRGEMIKVSNIRFGYREVNTDKILDIKNLSTGLKTFVILKTLLLNGTIQDKGTIILDEPEIHLHPEWQILFAEIIVLLQKEFNMHILLNTHSPYFLRAIQVYSAKYEIADKCNYYLAENVEDKAIIRDVTTDIDEIYAKLAKPFERLEVERYSDD